MTVTEERCVERLLVGVHTNNVAGNDLTWPLYIYTKLTADIFSSLLVFVFATYCYGSMVDIFRLYG